MDNILLRVSHPKWVLIFLGIIASGGIILYLPVFIFSLVHFVLEGFTIIKLLKSLYFFIFFAVCLGLGRYIYSSIIATESGLQVVGILRWRQKFTWDEIVGVSRNFDFVSIFSNSGGKIVILSSMTGYPELLELIQSRAPNLRPKRLAQELWSHFSPSPVRVVLIFFGLFVAYVIVRLILSI
ncbi:MAG: hypothetical protein ACREQA_11030 [Candidatus Binatia bacterium]